MKTKLHEAKKYYFSVHPLPMWIFFILITLAIISYACSVAVSVFPQLLPSPADYRYISEQLFELGHGLCAIGFIVSPLMDIVIKHDLENNP